MRRVSNQRSIHYYGWDYAFVANFIGKMNFFESTVIDSSKDSIDVEIKGKGIRFAIPKAKCRTQAKKGDSVLIGGRPEQLIVSAAPLNKCIEGNVHIIQHLGSFIRYEVTIDSSISPVALEIDMDSLQKDIHEGDRVYVGFKEDKISLFSPEGREL